MITELFLIGLVVGFLYFEWTDISPGGIVAPAYFALYIYEPEKLVSTIAASLALLLIIRFLAANLILYGRRKLLLAVLLSFLLKMVTDPFLFPSEIFQFDLHSIGYIIPGLVANEMDRQKVLPTLLSLGIVTSITFFIHQLF